jgi:hypothetical protein
MVKLAMFVSLFLALTLAAAPAEVDHGDRVQHLA